MKGIAPNEAGGFTCCAMPKLCEGTGCMAWVEEVRLAYLDAPNAVPPTPPRIRKGFFALLEELPPPYPPAPPTPKERIAVRTGLGHCGLVKHEF